MRNSVIGELVASLRAQDYPAELLDIYVLADNSTDGTARAARQAGATVFERFNPLSGRQGLRARRADQPHPHRAAPCPITTRSSSSTRIISSIRTSSPRWIEPSRRAATCSPATAIPRTSPPAGFPPSYSIWFLREARFLNYPRMKLHTNCAISGTGFLVSSKIIEENGGWPYHLLTEDIQFSAVCAANGWRIGYCDDAIVYDEQPVTFAQSWRQRMRWAKGLLSGQRPLRRIACCAAVCAARAASPATIC